jgi:hypothetical protein
LLERRARGARRFVTACRLDNRRSGDTFWEKPLAEEEKASVMEGLRDACRVTLAA